MKIVIAGKGGVGKTTISGTISRVFSNKGYNIIAVDSDPSMNMHTSIGVENPIPISKLKDIIAKRAVISPGIFKMNPKVDDIPEKYSAVKENIKLLVMGTVEEGGQGCICPETTFLRALLKHLVLKRDEILILDTEAGVEHLGRKVAENFNMMLVVVEPSGKAIETANRIFELSKDIGVKKIFGIGNKVSNEVQKEYIQSNLAFPVLEHIPLDQEVINGDMEGKPLFEIRKNSPARDKIVEISEKIEKIIKEG